MQNIETIVLEALVILLSWVTIANYLISRFSWKRDRIKVNFAQKHLEAEGQASAVKAVDVVSLEDRAKVASQVTFDKI